MTLAAVHLPPAATVLAAILVVAWCGFYWRRLGDDGVPESRRRLRRASMIVIVAALPVVVAGLSFIDPSVDQGGYVQAWTLFALLLGILVIIASIDIVNNVRLHAIEIQNQAFESARNLASSLDAHRRADRTTVDAEDNPEDDAEDQEP